ncbi:MAG: alcohol dehydrogenase [Devosia sp.]|uniref:zinc-binding dehydrogenase n=1 Tax=Devosia sp. TaxID=1871048 RepID=UPI00262675AB|nr:zinc-binding dehydrogenase [Devosia sp.]MDB5589414.1 alcohol dehydrogenase [Devosia sp.]
MRSVVFESFGVPEQVLGLAERPRPVPGAGQALVRLVLSPIHNHDLMTIAGEYGIKPALPAVPGTEAVGVVEALGEGVGNLSVGQRVAGGAEQTWAEFYLVDAARVVPVPDSVSDETACQLISMPLSAKMILADLKVKSGDWIIQNAGNGMVSKLVSRFGAEQGINVISLVRRDETVAELEALGIANVVSTQGAGWQERVRALTGGAPIIRALDSLGGDGPGQLLDVVADGAELVNFGAMTLRPLKITAAQLLFRGIKVRGFWGMKPNLAPEVIGRMFGEVVALAAKGELVLPIEAVFGLDRIADAVKASGEPGRKGKIALKP